MAFNLETPDSVYSMPTARGKDHYQGTSLPRPNPGDQEARKSSRGVQGRKLGD